MTSLAAACNKSEPACHTTTHDAFMRFAVFSATRRFVFEFANVVCVTHAVMLKKKKKTLGIAFFSCGFLLLLAISPDFP